MDRQRHAEKEAHEDHPARDRRAQAAVGQVVDQEGHGVGEGAPGEPIVDRDLHQDVGGGDDHDHGGDADPEAAIPEAVRPAAHQSLLQ